MEPQKTQTAKNNPEQKEQSWGRNHSRSQDICHSHSNRNSMVLAQSRYGDQWNKIKDPNMTTHNSSQSLFDKDAKNLCWSKESMFKKLFWEHWMSVSQSKKFALYLSPYAKTNSTWDKS